eukprot:3109250-Prorocentrum_lima.AAC.1
MALGRTQRQHIHLLPFHPHTNLLKTGFKDANQRCATVMIDLKRFLNETEDPEVYIASSGVILSCSPIPWQYIRCITRNESAKT